MGFGTLFIGYFLLLNLTYFGFTDLIAGLVMIMGLYKLSDVERNFSYAMYGAGLFSLLGVIELYNEVVSMFFRGKPILTDITAPTRYLAIAIISAYLLIGIRELAREVGIPELERRCKITMPISAVTFLIMVALEMIATENETLTMVLGVSSVILILVSFAVIIVNLVSIYTAYMRICMPEDVDNDPDNKPSRFGFVNKFRAHEEEKQREYAEYQLERFKTKHNKKKK